jgi:hypothetical protein
VNAIAAYSGIIARSDAVHRRLMSQNDINLHHSARLGVSAGSRETRRDDGNFIVLMQDVTIFIGHL